MLPQEEVYAYNSSSEFFGLGGDMRDLYEAHWRYRMAITAHNGFLTQLDNLSLARSAEPVTKEDIKRIMVLAYQGANLRYQIRQNIET